MRRIFVTGNPTAGKSHLAKLLAEQVGARRADGDAARYALRDDPRYAAAVGLYFNQDEATYYATTDAEARWANLRGQCETIWPAIREWVARETTAAELAGAPLVVECVNLLPDLVARDFPGEPLCVVVSASREEVARRLAEKPRWGHSAELQGHEAREFCDEQSPRYRALAESVGAPVFTSAEAALPWCIGALR